MIAFFVVVLLLIAFCIVGLKVLFYLFCLIIYHVLISPHIVQANPLHRLPILATTNNVNNRSRVFLMAKVGNGKNGKI